MTLLNGQKRKSFENQRKVPYLFGLVNFLNKNVKMSNKELQRKL